MENMFIYNLSENEYLVFKSQNNYFELFSGHTGSSTNSKLATFRGGRWIFEDYHEKKLFWFLFNIYKKDFSKAFKQYIRTLDEKPRTYIFTCAKRRFHIRITKLKRNVWDWIYETFYGSK